MLQEAGRGREALPLFERALAIDSRLHGPSHIYTAIALRSLGACLRDVGRPREALPPLERALGITRSITGPAHPRAAIVEAELGLALAALGRRSEATFFFALPARRFG